MRFALAFLAAGQSGSRSVRARRLGLLARRLAQIGQAHRDALAIEAHHQQVIGGLGLAQAVPVEQVEVLGRAHHQFLDLPLRNAGAGPLRDQLHDFVKR
jgi:hypothetical protein